MADYNAPSANVPIFSPYFFKCTDVCSGVDDGATSGGGGTVTTAENVNLTNDNSNGDYFIPFSKTTTTSNPLYIDSTPPALTYNPAISTLYSRVFEGNLFGGVDDIYILGTDDAPLFTWSSFNIAFSGTLQSFVIPTSAGCYCAMTLLPKGLVINNIGMYLTATGGTINLGTNGTSSQIGVYKTGTGTNSVLLASSSINLFDSTPSFTPVNGQLLTFPMTTPYTIPATGKYTICFLRRGTGGLSFLSNSGGTVILSNIGRPVVQGTNNMNFFTNPTQATLPTPDWVGITTGNLLTSNNMFFGVS
jgi:hypothetical protein